MWLRGGLKWQRTIMTRNWRHNESSSSLGVETKRAITTRRGFKITKPSWPNVVFYVVFFFYEFYSKQALRENECIGKIDLSFWITLNTILILPKMTKLLVVWIDFMFVLTQKWHVLVLVANLFWLKNNNCQLMWLIYFLLKKS